MEIGLFDFFFFFFCADDVQLTACVEAAAVALPALEANLVAKQMRELVELGTAVLCVWDEMRL